VALATLTFNPSMINDNDKSSMINDQQAIRSLAIAQDTPPCIG
jgi:hypothetical protein